MEKTTTEAMNACRYTRDVLQVYYEAETRKNEDKEEADNKRMDATVAEQPDAELSRKDIMEILQAMPFPSEYLLQKVPRKLQKKMEFPDPCLVYGARSSEGSGLLVFTITPSEYAMSFDDPQSIIDDMHEGMPDNQGLIEVNCGVTKNGHKYAYDIFKISDEAEPIPSVSWVINLNVERDDVILFLNGSYREEGTTGVRDSFVFSILGDKGALGENGLDGWFVDPYDSDYNKGFLMNLSEKADFDGMFPGHPLSMIRSFLRYAIEEW